MSFSLNRKKGTYNSIEIMSTEERADYKWGLMKSLLVHAHEHSPAFRSRLGEAGITPGDIRHFDDWSKIPILPKKDLPEIQVQGPRLGGLLTCDPGQLRRIFLSPGPIVDPEARQKDFWGFAEAFYAAGFRPGDVVQITFSYHFTPAGLMMEEPLQEIGCAVFPAGPGNTQGQIDALSRLKTNGFVGMASFLKIIADKAEKQGLDLKKDLNLDVAFVAAERLPETLRSELEERLDMVVRQGYGTADLGCAGYECSEKSGMH
ncbi:MAG: phenylacetate--CoA ligase family protein, partial [Desulfonatronovibrionaceae bacterium]